MIYGAEYPSWYFHAYTVAARIKAKLLCVSALSMNTQMYDGNKTMMVTFLLEQSLAHDARI